MTAPGVPLEVGDWIVDFRLPATTGGTIAPADLVGKPLVIFFYLQDGGAGCTTEVCAFRDLYPLFQRFGVAVLGIGVESLESHKAFAAANNLPFPLLTDASGETCARFGVLKNVLKNEVPPAPGEDVAVPLSRTTYLFGPDFRVARAYLEVSSPDHPAEVVEDARKLLCREEPRQIVSHAPVLIIPNVLPPDMRNTLIDQWATENVDSGFMKQIDGKTVGMTDYSHKIRRDHFLKPGDVQSRLQGYVGSRVVPLIRRAFNYDVTRREDFRIACYDSSRGGYFRPHRDNTTDGTAHRRFAMSLLLNDDYEGGYLRFPEYGQHTYRPDAGGAVIFSCSLLHEATDVTAGRRFVLLSFFYGEREAKIREEYNARTGGAYRA
jgi:peroxiredoxin